MNIITDTDKQACGPTPLSTPTQPKQLREPEQGRQDPPTPLRLADGAIAEGSDYVALEEEEDYGEEAATQPTDEETAQYSTYMINHLGIEFFADAKNRKKVKKLTDIGMHKALMGGVVKWTFTETKRATPQKIDRDLQLRRLRPRQEHIRYVTASTFKLMVNGCNSYDPNLG